jgi:hypothetical protein
VSSRKCLAGLFELKYDVKKIFQKLKVAYSLTKDIKGYHIHFFSSSNSSIEKSYDGYTVYDVIVAGGLPNLVILSFSIFREWCFACLPHDGRC